jgi:hypothetical protein
LRPRTRTSRFARFAAAAAVASLVASVSIASAAPAQTAGETGPAGSTTTPPEPTAGVSLVRQPAWIAPGGVEIMSLHLDNPELATNPDAAVEVTVHSSVSSRTEFNRAVSGEELGGTLSRLTFPLAEAQLNPRDQFLVGFGLSGSDAQPQVGIDSPGVYPVEVGVIGTEADHSPFVTWMVVIDEQTARSSQPLRVSWIWQLGSPPLELPSGGFDPERLAPMKPGGRLDELAKLLARAGDFPLTLGVGPEMLQGWADAAHTDPALQTGVARVRRAIQQPAIQLLPEPYVPIAGPTIEAEGLGGHLPDEYVEGSDTIDAVTGEIPDPRTALVDPINEPTVARLTQMLVGRFVVRDGALAPVPEARTPAQPFVLTTSSGSSTPAVASDSLLEFLLASPGPPALRAQRVMAALAEIAYEAPSQARGVVLAMPAEWDPQSGAVAILLRELARNPLVKPATLDTLFSDVAPAETEDGAPLRRQIAPAASPTDLPLQASEYEAAEQQLAAYQTIVGRTDPSVAAGERSLLLALSTAQSRDEALAYLDVIGQRLDALTGGVTTTAKAITLTARRASLPLSFVNNTGRDDIRVRVHLESPKLIFPKGPDVIMTLPIGHSTAPDGTFPVIARASGTFAMTITLESADGSLAFGPPTRVTIRSAVFSGIGIALTLGALVFLAGWWGNHFWRSRRARKRATLAP